mmetsp:Transcript_41819/g.61470  ORF Transcript_41819/g.61470 Transcript_41819/m.61470 type:complete len:203 (-) Transcript_41819:228-836(-)
MPRKKTAIKHTFRVIAALIQKKDTHTNLFGKYTSSAQKNNKTEKEQATQLFHDCDESGDGILELDEFAVMLNDAGLHRSKSNFLLDIFEEMTPARAEGMNIHDWCEYLEMLTSVSALKADIEIFFHYADLDGSGGLDAMEMKEVQSSLNLRLLSTQEITRFVMACGAEDENGDVSVDQIMSMVVLTWLRRERATTIKCVVIR